MEEKYYQLGTHTSEQFCEIHQLLCSETSEELIPDRVCTCYDEKLHSPTRGTFLLTDEEADALRADSRIKFLNIDYTSYPETYKAPPDELQATPAELFNRWNDTVKVYREFEGSNTLPGTPDSTDINRTGYQLLRPMQKLDPWVANSYNDNFVVESDIQQYGDGKDVDVIVADDGAGWMGHPEFQNNCTGAKPAGYVGGNVLPGNGTCDVLDLVLDAPYYLDPDYFDADPDNRLETRWDGTTVPVESFARGWWTSTSNRSNTFNTAHPTAGTVSSITGSYTRAFCNGSNTYIGNVGRHCTPCMALTYGRTQGWAYNANKWAVNLYGSLGTDIEVGFDMQKIFHNTKPINSRYNSQDPTVSSNSWGYRSNKQPGDSITVGTADTQHYHFRGGDPTAYTSENDLPWLSNMGVTGDVGRWKSEMKTNSYTESLDELIDSGVIFVCAAGNSNQKQVNWGHQDFDNYISINTFDTLEQSEFLEFGIAVTGTTNRRGFPQQGGKTIDPVTGEISYKTINIGALDDDYRTSREAKVTYSDRGEAIDFYMPADGTLAANRNYEPVWQYPDTYPGLAVGATDCAFGGTSAACPVAAGFLATIIGLNRSWTYQDVKAYLRTLDVQDPNDFYYGTESTSETDTNWNDYWSLEGGSALVGYQFNIQNTNDGGEYQAPDNLGPRARVLGNFVLKNGLKLRLKSE